MCGEGVREALWSHYMTSKNEHRDLEQIKLDTQTSSWFHLQVELDNTIHFYIEHYK